jgi:hypothetical protein
MIMKEKFVMEFVLHSCSHSVLWTAISTASGLGDWFADDVKLKDEKWIFVWDGVAQEATRLSCRDKQLVKFRWSGDATDCYFEFKINEDPLTGNVTLVITDFAEEADLEDARLLWEEQVRVLGLQLGIRI